MIEDNEKFENEREILYKNCSLLNFFSETIAKMKTLDAEKIKKDKQNDS